MAGTVMPAPKFIGLDNNANPVSGGKLYTYVAGTTTPQATYSDVDLSVANANPVILDSAGRATVFLASASYKFVLKDASDVTLWSQDNVQAVPSLTTNLDVLGVAGETLLLGQVCYLSDGSGGLTPGRWYLADSDLDYASSLPQIAMAIENAEAGASTTFRLQGQATKAAAQAALVIGDTYYVSGTAGALSTTPGTYARAVGQADSLSTLIISPNPPVNMVTPTFINGITVTSTDAGAAAAPYLDLYRDSASPAASDQLGELKFSGEDSAGNKQLYGRVYGKITDATSTSEDGQVIVSTVQNGTETTVLTIGDTLAVTAGGSEKFKVGTAGDILVSTSAGTAGQLLTSNGAGAAATWTTFTVTPTVLSKSAGYTVQTSDGVNVFVLCTNTITITLYAASGNTGKIVTVKNNGTGTITIDANGSETIDGSLTKTITAQYTSLSLLCDGTGWAIF